MIPHPAAWFDNPDTRPKEIHVSKWKTLLGWLLKWVPGVVEVIIEQKAKDAANKPRPSA